jgi:hypothetical protein
LPLPFFRRKKRTQDQPVADKAPAAVVTTPASTERPHAAPAEGDGAAKSRRRRGNRGGRNRRKPTTATATATATAAAKPKQDQRSRPQKDGAKDDAKPAERQRRPNARRRQAPRRAPLPAAKRELLVSVDVSE